MRLKTLTTLAVALSLSLHLSSASALDNDLLVFAGEAESTINPVLTSHQELPNLIFSGLLKYNGHGEVVADLAQSFSFDEKNLCYTFKLRDNVTWHDNKPFSADDVVFTYQALMDEDAVISTITSNYLDLKEVKALDPQTVQISLKRPNAALLGYFTLGILPKHLLDGEDLNLTSFNQNPVGTGRYKFVSWDLGSNRILLERNEDYYGKVPKIKNIVYMTIADENAKSLALNTGDADLAWLNAKYASSFRGKSGFKNYDFKSADFRAISPDFKQEFWKENLDLVPILNLAIDKEALVNAVLAGHGTVAYSPIQFSPLGGNPKANLYPYNLQLFEQKMHDLGWEKGADGIYAKNGQRCSFSIQVREYEQERVDLANLCASMLNNAGVEMKVNLVTRFDFNQGYDAYLSGFAAQYDPDQFFTSLVTGMSDNTTSYSNPEVDRLMDVARHENDPKKRQDLYQEFEMAYAKAPAAILLTYLDGNYVSTDKVSGLNTEVLLGHHAVGVMWNIEDWEIKD